MEKLDFDYPSLEANLLSVAAYESKDHSCVSDAIREIRKLRTALADAIVRPMGTVPDSALGLVTYEELQLAQKRFGT